MHNAGGELPRNEQPVEKHAKGGTRIDNIRKLAEALRVDPAELVEH